MAEIYDWFESRERRDILIYVLSMSGLLKSQGVPQKNMQAQLAASVIPLQVSLATLESNGCLVTGVTHICDI